MHTPSDLYRSLLQGLADLSSMPADLSAILAAQELRISGQAVGLRLTEARDAQPDSVFMFAPLRPLPAAHADPLYTLLLQANNLCALTGGFAISLQGPDDRVMVAGRVPLHHTTPRGLLAALTRLARVARTVQRLIEDDIHAAFGAADTSAAGKALRG